MMDILQELKKNKKFNRNKTLIILMPQQTTHMHLLIMFNLPNNRRKQLIIPIIHMLNNNPTQTLQAAGGKGRWKRQKFSLQGLNRKLIFISKHKSQKDWTSLSKSPLLQKITMNHLRTIFMANQMTKNLIWMTFWGWIRKRTKEMMIFLTWSEGGQKTRRQRRKTISSLTWICDLIRS